MSVFYAWASMAVFGTLGMIVALGVRVTEDPTCMANCYLNMLARAQADFGGAPLATLLFFIGGLGFFIFATRI